MPETTSVVKPKLFDIKLLPYDMAHGLMIFLGAFARPRKIDAQGKKYKTKVPGGVLIVGNHVSFSDPLVYSNAFAYKRVWHLAAESVLRNKFRIALMTAGGAIRIDRNIADVEAIRKCTKVIKGGHGVVMYPQGGIHADADLSDIKSGAVFIAVQGKCPIIPVYSEKPKHWYNRRLMVIGEPFIWQNYCSKRFPSVSETDEISKELLKVMQNLKEIHSKTLSK